MVKKKKIWLIFIVIVCTAVIELYGFFAPRALAQGVYNTETKPLVNGEVACGGHANRHQMITWTVANSDTAVIVKTDNSDDDPGDTAQGRSMKVDQISVSSGWVDGITPRMTFPPRPYKNSSREAITDISGDYVGEVTLYVRADWKGETSPQDISSFVTVSLSGTCKNN